MFPILSSLIILPLIGSLFLIFIRSSEKNNSLKYVALFITFANFFLSLYLWKIFDPSISTFQFEENRIWIEGFINYKVGIDGISNIIKKFSSYAVKFQSGFIYQYAFIMLLGFSILLTFLIIK